MTTVFDSTHLAPQDRVDATVAAMQEQTAPQTVIVHDPDNVACRMDVWQYGSAAIFQAKMTGFRLVRGDRHIRAGLSDQLAIALHADCTGRQEQYGDHRMVSPNELMITEMNSPYSYEITGPGTPYCLYVPLEELLLPHEVVRSAAGRLRSSPLHDLLVEHITVLTREADVLSNSPVVEELGETGIEMARALIASAYDAEYARGMMAEVLLPRIRGYVRRHLDDPGLTADKIAHAHDISTRRLFRLCREAGFSLEQWIIGQRLRGSHTELARPETRNTAIATIARRWGFTNPSYFTRRFRDEYGLTPREWRQLAAQQSVADSPMSTRAVPMTDINPEDPSPPPV